MIDNMKPGTKMPNGSIFAGNNPVSGFPIFTTIFDWRSLHTWLDACQACNRLGACSVSDWRLPSQDELAVLYENRVAIGNFAEEGLYWCSVPNYLRMVYWAQDFATGQQVIRRPHYQLMFRPVRGREI